MPLWNKHKLSVVLATFNEEANIRRCLEAVKNLTDDLVVVDGSSTDNTVKIAKHLGAQVISTSNKPIFHINKQLAMNEAKGEWVLQLDADEVVDDELKQSIRDIVSSDSEFDAFWIKRKNYFLGKFLTKGGQYPDMVIRLYRNGKARLPQKDVHEQMEVDGTIGIVDGHLLHYNAPTFKRYIANANSYTSLTAHNMKQNGLTVGLIHDLQYLFWKPVWTFLKIFFRHKGYRDGFPGFVFALFSGLHFSLAYMKLADLNRYESRD